MSWGRTDPDKKREANRRYYLLRRSALQFNARQRYRAAESIKGGTRSRPQGAEKCDG